MARRINKKIIQTDVLVIGAGSAGLSAALTARERGKRVVIVEKGKLGGECPNYACVPTKAMLVAAKAYDAARYDFPKYGVVARDLGFSFSQAMRYKKTVVDTITGKGQRLKKMLRAQDIDLVKGDARFLDPHHVQVGKKVYKAKKIILATGVVDWVPPIDGIKSVDYLTYRDVTTLKKRPASVAIIGGGPVGVEFATFFGLIDVDVTVFEVAPHILGYEDEEIALFMQAEMRKRGIRVLTNTKVLGAKKKGSKTALVYQEGGSTRKRIEVDACILAAGKRANIQDLDIQKAGVKLDDKGRLMLKETLQTSKTHIFAAGDVTGKMKLTSTAHRDGEVAGWNACTTAAKMRTIDNRVVPRVTFGIAEVASVGITIAEAKKGKYQIDLRTFPVGALGRAVAENKRQGKLKVVLEKKTGKILGAHMFGEHAGDVIHELSLAMQLDVTFDQVQAMLHAFPTYSEAIAAAY